MKQLFSDFFEISEYTVESYGAFNISLVSDLPLFIDPFRLFNSRSTKYKKLHNQIIEYLVFLRDKSLSGELDGGLIEDLFTFREVKQNWFGYSRTSNKGSGLGLEFAKSLNENFRILNKFGEETISKSHLEKLTLINDGVGRDNISDFTTNLIKEFLLNYTQTFARKYLPEKFRQIHGINKVRFNYKTQVWEDAVFELPNYDNTINENYVILTPADLLTKDETWINRSEMLSKFQKIANAVDNEILKSRLNNYFREILSKIAPKQKKKDGTDKEPAAKYKSQAASAAIKEFPEFLDYFLKYKEEHAAEADAVSSLKVVQSKLLYLKQFSRLAKDLAQTTDFYQINSVSYEDCFKKLEILKNKIENENGNEVFHFNEKPILDEDNLSILFRMTWKAHQVGIANTTDTAEIITVWKKSKDKLKIVLKLSTNPRLKQTLEKLRDVYVDSSTKQEYFLVIVHYSSEELNSVKSLLNTMGVSKHENIIFINAERRGNLGDMDMLEKNFGNGSDFTSKDVRFNGYGLLIGVGDDLPVTVGDATGLYNILVDTKRAAYPHHNVQLLTENNAKRKDILDGLDKLIKQSKSNNIETAIIYYSGHGGKIGNEYYLAPFARDVSRPKNTLVSGKEFSEKVEAIKAKKLIVILDCCRAGGIPITKDTKSFFESNPPQNFLDRLSKGSGKVIITSSHENENSLILPGSLYSIFTECLLEALSGKGTRHRDGYAKILDILSYLLEEVPKRTNNKQHPFLNNITNLSEDFAVCYYAGGLKEVSGDGDSLVGSASPSITSSKLFRLQDKLEGLEASRKLLITKVNRYRNELIIEASLPVKMQLEFKLVETEAELKKIEAEIDDIESWINSNH